MQTITTKYYGPTNTLGSRIEATHEGGAKSITLNYDYGLNTDQNHMKAAKALKNELNWKGEMVGGWIKDGMTFVFKDSITII